MRGAMKRQRNFQARNARSSAGPMPERTAVAEPRMAMLAFAPRDASRALMARLLGRAWRPT